jgi:hypothetical protein
MTPITDTKTNDRRDREGPRTTFCIAEKQRAFSAPDHREVGRRHADWVVIFFPRCSGMIPLATDRMPFDIGRRQFISALGAASLAWPLAARAAQGRPRIAVLALNSKDVMVRKLAALRDGLRRLGYIDTQTADIDTRYADGDLSRLPALAGELLQLRPDVILADSPSAATAAHNATSTLPIVCPIFSDSVVPSLAASYAHPGGNVTGVSNIRTC